MSKCLYTEAEVTQSGAQLLINAISFDDVKRNKFRHAFPEAWKAMRDMVICKVDDPSNKVNVGDVIWTQQGGNKHIGFCIIKEHEESDINKKAVGLCMKSARNKARELNCKYVGMDLFASKTPQDWANIVDIVENELQEIQGIVCIPTNDELVKVLENLPGSRNFRMITNKD